MNEELAIVLGLVLALIAIVLAYTFMSQGTDATIGSMDFVSEHTDRDIGNSLQEGFSSRSPEVVEWQRDLQSPQVSL